MADLVGGWFDRIYSLIESHILLRWRTTYALCIFLLSSMYAYFSKGIDFIKDTDHTIKYYLIPEIIFISITCIWFYCRYKYKMMPSKRKIGIVIISEKYGSEKVNNIIHPVVAEVSEEIFEIEFIILPSNSFRTEQGGIDFLKSNDYGLEEAMLIYANVGKINGADSFLIDETFFCVNRPPSNAKIFDLALNKVAKDSASMLRNYTFPMSDEIRGTKEARLSIKDTLLYYIGLSAIFQGNTDLALLVLKKILSSQVDSNTDDKEESLRLQRNRKILPHTNLTAILSGLCQINLIKYHREGRDPKMVISFLKEYALLLHGNKDAFNIYLALARYSYDSDNQKEAREYTGMMQSINPSSPLLLLNLGFFAMIDKNVFSLTENYKKLVEYIIHSLKSGKDVAYYPLEIIEFLYEQEHKYPECITLLRYGTGIHYIFLVDYEKGLNILNNVVAKTDGLKEFRLINTHTKGVLKTAAALKLGRKANARRSPISKAA